MLVTTGSHINMSSFLIHSCQYYLILIYYIKRELSFGITVEEELSKKFEVAVLFPEFNEIVSAMHY